MEERTRRNDAPVRIRMTWSALLVVFLLSVFICSYSASSYSATTDFGQGIVPTVAAPDEQTSVSEDFEGRASVVSSKSNYDPLDRWYWKNPLPQGRDLVSVAYGNNTFVALTNGGDTVATSSDGITWEVGTTGDCTSQYVVRYGKNIFVSVGSLGSICTSSDGITWTKRNSEGDWFWDVAYGSGTFVAVGMSRAQSITGVIYTSPDGITWTPSPFQRTSKGSNGSIAYGNGIFVICGGDVFLTSPDGVNWTERPTSIRGIWGMTYGNGTFVAVGSFASVHTSPDGINWTSRSIPVPYDPVFYDLMAVIWANGVFVALMDGKTEIFTSPDAVAWTERATGAEKPLAAIGYGSNSFVAVGVGGVIVASPDANVWTQSSSGSFTNFNAVAYGNNTFVTSNGRIALTSPDGAVWNTTPLVSDDSLTSYTIRDIVYGNGLFVAVGSADGKDVIRSSSDGMNWTNRLVRPSSAYSYFRRVVYGNGTFVAIGDSFVYTSADGLIWTERPMEIQYRFNGITYGNGMFFAVGSGDYADLLLTSPDGIKWTVSALKARSEFYGIAYGNNTLVAVGQRLNNGKDVVLVRREGRSPSLRSWSNDAAGFNLVNYITFASGKFILALGVHGKPFATSSDGLKWTVKAPSLPVTFNSIAYANGVFVGVGADGAILRSGNACPLIVDPSVATPGPESTNLIATIYAPQSGCFAPDISTNRSWIGLSGFSFGGGSGSVTVNIAENDSFLSRMGEVSLGSATFTVTQSGAQCAIASIDPSSASFGRNGGPGSFTANVTPSDCKWSVRGVPAWVKLTSGSQGVGSGVVTFTVKPNGGKKSRTGSMSVVLARGGTKSKVSVTQDAQ